MIVGSEDLYNETKESLVRLQEFDVNSLPRESELGSRLNFSEAVPVAEQLIDLYKRLSITALEDFPDPTLTQIRDTANNNFNLFSQILDFDLEQQNPADVRAKLLEQLSGAYPHAFNALHQYIAYSLHRSADFQRLDSDARSTIQSITDQSEKITEQLKYHEEEAQRVLDEIRRVAAEEGVTKQASHFNAEYEHHNSEAATWQKYSVRLAIGLGAFALFSLFLHKIPLFAPENTYDTIQLSISKVLIFSVIAYMLFLSTKNFLNHKHNAIVNKHRQNALMTHSALVEASGEEGVRDAVLLQAASCIFSPQSTGYTSDNEREASTQKSLVEIMSRPISQAAKDISR
tara:strand:+ start:4218 stop:5252 length:1035 start_codon:yes stop_codon:yes gene_type:complete